MNIEIVFLLDRSGSMQSILHDAIGGFNAFLAEQKRSPDAATFSLIFFNDKFKVIHNQAKLLSVPQLTERDFVPSGMTALNDAVGHAIALLDGRTRPEDRVILAIMTDGEENASREYSTDAIRQILEQRQENGWTVIYLGANQDAFKVGRALGIAAATTAQFDANSAGVTRAYADMSSSVLRARACL
jgi:Mg-chelatase subunit ChlD